MKKVNLMKIFYHLIRKDLKKIKDKDKLFLVLGVLYITLFMIISNKITTLVKYDLTLVNYIELIPFSFFIKLSIQLKRQADEIEELNKTMAIVAPHLRSKIVEIEKNLIMVYSETFLSLQDKKEFEIIINSTISSINQKVSNKRMFEIKHKKGKDNNYKHLDKYSSERLEAILTFYRDKPDFIKESETETEIKFYFYTKSPMKKLVKLLPDIGHKLGCKRGELEIYFESSETVFVLKKNTNKIYYMDDIMKDLKKDKKMGLPFLAGINKSGRPELIDLLNIKHLLIGGKNGSGKSNTVKQIIETLMYFNQNIAWVMVDFAESALIKYQDFSNTRFIESDFDSVIEALQKLENEYKVRKKLFRDNNCEDIKEYNFKNPISKLPFVIFAVDEANCFKEDFKKEEFSEIDKIMNGILKRYRKYGIFTLQIVQRSQESGFSMSWKTQFSKIGHYMNNITDAKNLIDNSDIAEKLLNLSIGEFVVAQEGKEANKYKACLSNNQHNRLFKVLERRYKKDDKHLVNLEKENEKVPEKIARTAND